MFSKHKPLYYIESLVLSIFLFREAWVLYANSNPIVNHWALPAILLLKVLSFIVLFIPFIFTIIPKNKIRIFYLIVIIFSLSFRYIVMREAMWKGYMSDSIAFTHYSAELILDKKNPYLYSMKPSYNKYDIHPRYITLHNNGSTEDRITYPSLNFLIIVPLIKLGLTDIRIFYFIIHILILILIFKYINKEYAIIFITSLCFLDVVTNLAIGGNTDILWVFFLLFTVPYFNNIIITGIAVGFACSLKQTPWVFLPFLSIEYLKCYGIKNTLKFLTIVGIIFFGLNLPFIINNCSAWFNAITAPFLSTQIMYGRGFNIISQSSLLNINKGFFTLLLLFVFLFLVLFQMRLKDKSRYIFWMFPGLCLFFTYRSLPNYIAYWYFLMGLYWMLDDKYKKVGSKK